MCHRSGLPPISIIGFGFTCVSSLRREPNPPARMTVFMALFSATRLAVARDSISESTRCHAGVLGRPIQHRPDHTSELTGPIATRRIALHAVNHLKADDSSLHELPDRRFDRGAKHVNEDRTL